MLFGFRYNRLRLSRCSLSKNDVDELTKYLFSQCIATKYLPSEDQLMEVINPG